ncbi:hypothetical protein [Pleionea sediminis]|uniref:hypothetical protein n=1 Tax=Pleionea sediminis TaxID=2569479 RepID=UPI00118715FC|nr:hypothetical protein [Pleionea sediminis]
MKIDIDIYNEILNELLVSSQVFKGVSQEISLELKEDFETIVEDIDISKHSATYTGGVTKTTLDLLEELKQANMAKDKQKCAESIACLRSSIMSAESALSNAADSLEKLVVSIRDA